MNSNVSSAESIHTCSLVLMVYHTSFNTRTCGYWPGKNRIYQWMHRSSWAVITVISCLTYKYFFSNLYVLFSYYVTTVYCIILLLYQMKVALWSQTKYNLPASVSVQELLLLNKTCLFSDIQVTIAYSKPHPNPRLQLFPVYCTT